MKPAFLSTAATTSTPDDLNLAAALPAAELLLRQQAGQAFASILINGSRSSDLVSSAAQTARSHSQKRLNSKAGEAWGGFFTTPPSPRTKKE